MVKSRIMNDVGIWGMDKHCKILDKVHNNFIKIVLNFLGCTVNYSALEEFILSKKILLLFPIKSYCRI